MQHRFNEIMGYIERQYDDILAEESRIKRNPRFRDNRVHALLYFITPTGHACVLGPFCIAVRNPTLTSAPRLCAAFASSTSS